MPKGAEKEKTYGHCKDNGVAAIGRIIRYHSAHIDATPYIALWMHFLPLKHDKEEGMDQNSFLVHILLYSLI
jgi:hypothetical protein